MEAYAGKQFVGIDLHGEQVEYPNVSLPGWVGPHCWSTRTPIGGCIAQSLSLLDETH
jgi:hypothetical protein